MMITITSNDIIANFDIKKHLVYIPKWPIPISLLGFTKLAKCSNVMTNDMPLPKFIIKLSSVLDLRFEHVASYNDLKNMHKVIYDKSKVVTLNKLLNVNPMSLMRCIIAHKRFKNYYMYQILKHKKDNEFKAICLHSLKIKTLNLQDSMFIQSFPPNVPTFD